MAAPSSIAFPSSDTTNEAQASYLHIQPPPRPPYLPFRRISLPTPPSLVHRESVVSVASFDSLPEEGSESSLTSSQPQRPAMRNATSNVNLSGGQYNKRPKRLSMSSNRKSQHVGKTNEATEEKRRKVINEFYATERAYVDGLELIYSHFLTPIIASLDTPEPLLDRSVMTAVFSNFIDIWNLHRSFFSALTSALFRHNQLDDSATDFSAPIVSSVTMTTSIPLSPLLLSHFPYLSLYTPFISSFSTTLSTLNNLITPHSPTAGGNGQLEYSSRFAQFVKQQEADPRCGKLKLRDWLLTIVQRCPRYLLLLKDLISCTNPGDPERAQLEKVQILVAKITTSLNTSLQNHAQTLALLALQRATPNLPFQLISPGRTLLKRGPLLQVERSSPPHEREFLLFSDCLIWLIREDDERAEKGEKVWGALAGLGGLLSSSGEKPDKAPWGSRNGSRTSFGNGSKTNLALTESPPTTASAIPPHHHLKRPGMVRTRSKSDADVTALQAKAAVMTGTEDGDGGDVGSSSQSPAEGSSQSEPQVQSSVQPKRRSYAGDQRIRTKSSAAIPRITKVKRHASTDDWAGSSKDRWVFKGKADLVDLEVVVPVKMRRRPSSVGDQVVRDLDEEDEEEDESERKWEVLSPEGSFVVYADTEQERDNWISQIRHAKAQLLVSLNVTHPNSTLTSSASTNHLRKTLQALPFLPEDEKGKKKKKSERRTRVEHWVPAIWIPDEKAEGCMRCGRAFGWRRRRHHCRLCGRCVCAGCSDRTFFISDPRDPQKNNKPARACNACYETVFPLLDPHEEGEEDSADQTPEEEKPVAETTFPSWLSMPSLPLSSFIPGSTSMLGTPEARERPKSRDLENLYERAEERQQVYDLDSDEERERRKVQVVRSPTSTSSRPRSYHQILEDFLAAEQGKRPEEGGEEGTSEDPSRLSPDYGIPNPKLKREVSFAPSLAPSVASSKRHTVVHLAGPESSMLLGEVNGRREDTARRNKRFSMPAVALQTTSVTTRTAVQNQPEASSSAVPAAPQNGLAVLGVPTGAGASILGAGVFGNGQGQVGGLPASRAGGKSSGSLLFGKNHHHNHNHGSTHHHHHHHVLGSTDFMLGSKLKKSLRRVKSGKIDEEMDVPEETQESQLSPPVSPPVSPSSSKHDLGKGVAAGKLSELLSRKKSKLLG
ncbi:hypothetical protein V5O48_014626 [Marasmius crinis-equi]|uniref:Uncharacterized protein n=1 Tax=Marasmius crinis-equi TaxID=585013 RepID=A0ABR3EX37_9AGAR